MSDFVPKLFEKHKDEILAMVPVGCKVNIAGHEVQAWVVKVNNEHLTEFANGKCKVTIELACYTDNNQELYELSEALNKAR